MRRAWRLAVTVGAIGMVVGAVVEVWAQAAAALVLEVRGPSNPALAPFTEIRADSVVSLSPGSRLVFVHYKTCHTVAVVGGQIRVGSETYTLTGGTRELDERRSCPRRVALKGGGDVGGIILRSVPLTLPTQPSIVVVGPRAGDFTALRILRGGELVLEARLADRRFHWPSGTAPLAAGTEYELALVPARPGTDPVTAKFRTVTSAADSSGDAPVVVAVE